MSELFKTLKNRKVLLPISFAVSTLVSGCSDDKPFTPAANFCINEVAAQNKTVDSPLGNSADWIELYNFSSDTVQLGTCFITDDREDPYKKPLPNQLLAPGEFFLLWAEESGLGGNDPYLGFNISDNETIYIFTRAEEIVDSVDLSRYEDVNKRETLGRFPDGGTRWGVQNHPSPNQENEG